MEIYIYGLYNSFSEEIRYVGKTNDLKRRLEEHICEAKSKKYEHFPKNRWILKTLKNGGVIKYKILETANEKNWVDREIYWIAHYRSLGKNLNLSRGGETCQEFFFPEYDACKEWVKKNVDCKKINSSSKWKQYAKDGNFPPYIPHNPWSLYRYDGFSWHDFLGKEGINNYHRLKNDYLSFQELSSYIIENKVQTLKELLEKIKRENITNIPRDTVRYYKKRGFNVSELFNNFFTYEEFVEYIRLNYPTLTSAAQYYKMHKYMDKKAPFYFKEVYNNVQNIDQIFVQKFVSYKECQQIAVKNKITKPIEYYKFFAEHKGLRIPSHPEITYKHNGWDGWEEFLKIKNKKMRKKCSFELFCKYMKLYHPGIKSSVQYKEMMKSMTVSKRIPFRPDVKYKCKWGKIFNGIAAA